MNPLLFPPSRLARSVLHSESDERLAALAQAGSDAAFEAIVTRHRHGLVRLCARIVGDTDAEEAVQNAIISAHLALARGDRVHNLGPWLRAIAHNASLNILRARAARPEYPDGGQQLTEAHEDPAARREQLGELVAAVQSLPQRQRHAIVMRELEGRSYDEIADRLGSTNGAVRQLLNRARAAVRDRLAVLPGLEPLARWLSGGSSGAAGARIGALAGGCTLSAKLCASALVPAVIAGGAGAGLVPALPRPTTTTTKRRAAPARSRSASVGSPRPRPTATPRPTAAPRPTATPRPAVTSTRAPVRGVPAAGANSTALAVRYVRATAPVRSRTPSRSAPRRQAAARPADPGASHDPGLPTQPAAQGDPRTQSSEGHRTRQPDPSPQPTAAAPPNDQGTATAAASPPTAVGAPY